MHRTRRPKSEQAERYDLCQLRPNIFLSAGLYASTDHPERDPDEHMPQKEVAVALPADHEGEIAHEKDGVHAQEGRKRKCRIRNDVRAIS